MHPQASFRLIRRIALSLATAALLASCGGGSSSCIEGSAQPCACGAGLSGVQVCTAEGAFGPCDCGVDGGSLPDGGIAGSGESVTRTVGPEGGELSLARLTLVIPEGALSSPTEITITETTDLPPEGFTAYSPVYEFLPHGLTFAVPAVVEIEYSGTRSLAGLFMTHPESLGWERIGGLPAETTLSAEIEHFSSGFVADSVDYTDPPDLSCVRTHLLQGFQLTPESSPEVGTSAVSLSVSAEDCWGRPITGLGEGDLRVLEQPPGGSFEPVSSEASVRLLPREGVHVFLTLLIDMSSSTASVLGDVVDGIQALLDRLDGLPVHVGVHLFAGSATVDRWEPHRLDLDPDDGVAFAALRARLSELSSYEPEDAASTNLNGAVAESFQLNASAQRAIGTITHGNASYSAGYVLLFTDGRDTAGILNDSELAAVLDGPEPLAPQVIAVGLEGDDFDGDALRSIAGDGAIIAPSPATLEREFAHLARRIAGQTERTYHVGYCSPSRDGNPRVAVEVTAAEAHEERAELALNASVFGPGCDAATITSICDAYECGGFGCGACDARSEFCEIAADGSSSVCRNTCDSLVDCGNVTVVNDAGYTEMCTGPDHLMICEGECVDTRSSTSHCGGCGIRCGGGSDAVCVDGTCGCMVPTQAICGESCQEVMSNPGSCGDCTTQCVAGQGCDGGSCDPMRLVSAGYRNGCTIRASGVVSCWGSNGSSWINPRSTAAVAPPYPMYPPSARLLDGVSVSAAFERVCIVRATGELYCSGLNTSGALGDSIPLDAVASTPVRVGSFDDLTQVVTGRSSFTCVVHTTGTVSCFGANSYGQLGDGTTDPSSVPVTVSGISAAEAIDLSIYGGCARLDDGDVRCWGGVPSPATTLSDTIDVCVGWDFACAVNASGSISCWGDNTHGQLGDGTNTSSADPVTVSGLTSIETVRCRRHTVCARRSDDTLACWGRNQYAQFGNGVAGSSNLPVDAAGGMRVEAFDLGEDYVVVVTPSGESYSWGSEASNQLGRYTATPNWEPYPMARGSMGEL